MDRNNLKFVSLSRRQWERFGAVFEKRYPHLVQEAKQLEIRYLSLSDLFDHDDGLVPSLRIDADAVNQRKLKYIEEMKLNITHRTSRSPPNVNISFTFVLL